MIANLAQSLMPGGSVEKSYIDDAMQEGKQLSAQLNAASVAKGLGNATSSAPVTAMKHVAKRKTEIRSGLLQQLLPLLQNLMSMEQQQGQFEASQALNRGPTLAERGLDAFGQPMGSKFPSLGNRGGTQSLESGGGTQTTGFSAKTHPSLASAGGMQTGSQAVMEAPSLFGGASVGGGGSKYGGLNSVEDFVKAGAVSFNQAEDDAMIRKMIAEGNLVM